MIPRVNERTDTPHAPLGEALGRAVRPEGSLTEHAVVAHWPGLNSYLDGEQATWSAAQWAEHLQDPLFNNPFTSSPAGGRKAFVHIGARFHPDDRDLSGAEWAEVAHRLARAAGIEIPGDQDGCRWIAVQAKPGRIDLIANLVRLDGTWQRQPAHLPRRLADEARRIEQDLRLRPPAGIARDRHGLAESVPTGPAQLAALLTQLADEHSGPLATVRGLIEHTAHRVARQPGTRPAAARAQDRPKQEAVMTRSHDNDHDAPDAEDYEPNPPYDLPVGVSSWGEWQGAGPDTAHRLELIARRLHGIQQDLDTTAARMNPLPRPTPPATTPAPAPARSAVRPAPRPSP
ncbi:hypothetical protein AQI95_35940 [Streptomyces yokosukanensis]|uniref:Relaxase/mobilization nuclease n=1 Tax=Streptomyces yokosukanensis TaxID=67386 RepID=A0A101NV41_9ACTN|nr:hypothetical protein [Streptomyces yokosukanensis]KUM99911.1 hypothetical protein AQI95_35940 [Streptomyces yokosukanensis]